MRQTRQQLTMLALFGMTLSTGCGSDVVLKAHAQVNLIDRTAQPLTAVGTLTMVTGSYGDNCQYRSTSGFWSLGINGTRIPEGSDLVVNQRDPDCSLSLLSITATDSAGSPHSYVVDPPLSLREDYQVSASRCHQQSAAIAFFADARLRSPTGQLFSRDFFLDLVYSEDPLRIDSLVQGQYASVQATAEAAGIPTPDYQADTSSIVLRADAGDRVAATTSGQVLLQAGSQPAQLYVITTTDPGTSAGSIDATYRAGTSQLAIGSQLALSTIGLGLLPGYQLPLRRYLILANFSLHTPTVRSYQVFAFQFTRQ